MDNQINQHDIPKNKYLDCGLVLLNLFVAQRCIFIKIDKIPNINTIIANRYSQVLQFSNSVSRNGLVYNEDKVLVLNVYCSEKVWSTRKIRAPMTSLQDRRLFLTRLIRRYSVYNLTVVNGPNSPFCRNRLLSVALACFQDCDRMLSVCLHIVAIDFAILRFRTCSEIVKRST